MRRIAPLLLALTMSSLASRAWADPMMLHVTGEAFGKPINESIDVTHGFSGEQIPLVSQPIVTMPGFRDPGPGGGGSLSSSFNLDFDLTMGGKFASTVLSGPIVVGYQHPSITSDLSGGGQGSAKAASFNVSPGLDSSLIPDWFKGLSASVSGGISGGHENLLGMNLYISPGQASVSSASPVPEPSALAVLLIGFGALVKGRRRKL